MILRPPNPTDPPKMVDFLRLGVFIYPSLWPIESNSLRTDGLKKYYLYKKQSEMSTIELREKIISQLANINDTSFLRAIKVLVDTKVEKEVYRLSDYQKERILLGREQLKKGQTISHDEIQKEINQWLG
jgi:hypothetical protein